MQFKGKHNDNPPKELVGRVNAKLKQFGDEGGFDNLTEDALNNLIIKSWIYKVPDVFNI